MPIIEVSGTALKLIENDPKRKFVSFTNIDDSHMVFISDEPDPTETDAKWNVMPGQTLIITRAMGFPERVFYGISDGQAKIVIGFQNEDERER